MTITAAPDHCEEASPLSVEAYIPCNAPAVRTLWCNKDQALYRMCASCAQHNIRRGMKDLGPFVPEGNQ